MKPIQEIHYTMGTFLDLTLFDFPTRAGRRLLRQGFQQVRRLERLLSAVDPDSALSQLNCQAGRGPVRIESELWQLLHHCVELSRQTAGTFDIRVSPLTAGHYASASGHPRDDPRPSFHLYPSGWIELEPGVQLDLGGIGKGYAVDRLVTQLRAANVHRAFINFGDSSLYLLGDPPRGENWPILVQGIEADDIVGLLWAKNCALSTSSSVGKHPEPGAAHIVDPRTGRPLDSPRLSTILAPGATLAEALSTAAVVHGEAWGELLCRFPAAAGLYVGPDRIPYCTPGLTRQFQPYAEVS